MCLILELAYMKTVTNVISGKVEMPRNQTVRYIAGSLKKVTMKKPSTSQNLAQRSACAILSKNFHCALQFFHSEAKYFQASI